LDRSNLPAASESDYWYVVFHEKTSLRWLWWIGRFKHVSAFTYVAGFRMWEVYDVQNHRTRILRFSHDEWIKRSFRVWTADAAVVKISCREVECTRIASRFLFFCGPAIKHLIGLSCLAVRPDAIYRECLRNGGELLGPKDAEHSGRPELADRTG